MTASPQRIKKNDCTGYDTKQSDGKDPVLDLWGMWSTPSLILPRSPLWQGMAASDRVLSMCQIELFDIQTIDLC